MFSVVSLADAWVWDDGEQDAKMKINSLPTPTNCEMQAIIIDA